jgi:hypothetical protein
MNKFTIYFFFLLTIITACSKQKSNIQLQTGDLLFRGTTNDQLSEAIDKVTHTNKETHFSHVGIVQLVNDSVFVLHASTKGGTCRVSLNKFLYAEDSVTTIAYRLKGAWQQTIPSAIKRAEKMLGTPYNYSYILTDTAHYCSEFIYTAFAPDSVFELHPMSFKEEQTGKFFPTWIEYYQKLNIHIPEGEPGCNPNGMASSEKLIRLGVINQ